MIGCLKTEPVTEGDQGDSCSGPQAGESPCAMYLQLAPLYLSGYSETGSVLGPNISVAGLA